MAKKTALDLSVTSRELFERRASHSKEKLEALTNELAKSTKAAAIPELCVFAAGSYGRHEASDHSDIDLFFITSKSKQQFNNNRIPTIQLFSDVIDIGSGLNFPKFSNDGEFLKLLFLEEIEENLGSRDDDFLNHFTSRMLLMLESKPVYGHQSYESILRSTIGAYFRDYTHHPKDFKPTFLVNDIIRFWKTLCLNYEHGRNQGEERAKLKQKIKNFKLKFSRLTTCFATVAYLSTFRNTISPQDVYDVCLKTPHERMEALAQAVPATQPTLVKVFEEYAWFMELTGLTKDQLEEYFADKDRRSAAFARAQQFGDLLFEMLLAINKENNVLRFMVL